MKAAIYSHTLNSDAVLFFRQLINELNENNIHCLFHSSLKETMLSPDFLNEHCSFFENNNELTEKKADLLISIGGDGTFLNSLDFVKNSGIPIVGINLGRLGFLANISKEDIREAVNDIANNRFTIEKRALLSIENLSTLKNNVALNEISIQKEDSAMISISTFINKEYLNTYWADGLIVSTPTGSTAYSLSVGGPIIVPGAQNFVISPISPHTLTVRPVVISDQSELRFKISARNKKYLLSVDHYSYHLEETQEIVVKRAAYDLNLIKLEGISFYKTLREKLMWGLDRRN